MPVICYICGREFGSASIAIHIPQCEKKWEAEQQKLPKKNRRPLPTKPDQFDRIAAGDLKGQALQKAMEAYNQQAFDDFNQKALEECGICGRTFLPKALEIHSRSCKPGKNVQKRPPRSVNREVVTKPSPFESRPPPQRRKSPSKLPKPSRDTDPSIQDLITAIQKEPAFESVENRKKLLQFIHSLVTNSSDLEP